MSFDLVFEAEQVRNNDDPFASAYPNDPWLADAQTSKGRVFWNNFNEEFPLQPGQNFNDLLMIEDPGQPVYVNTTDEQITVSSTGGGANTSFTLDPYSGDPIGAGDTGWYRIPTGIGTPHPDNGNYEFVGITETSDGYEAEWQQV